MNVSIDGWYRAVGLRATFAFEVRGGEVVTCAPYGRKIILGLQWATAYMKLEHGGFKIERLADPPAQELDHDAALKLLREIRDGKHSLPGTLVQIDRLFAKTEPTGERAMRFGFLLSEIEVSASQILHGIEPDIPTAMVQMNAHVREATAIALEVSREALDKVTTDAGHIPQPKGGHHGVRGRGASGSDQDET